MTRLGRFLFFTGSLLAASPLVGCSSPHAVRGGDVQGLDDQAMSTGLDQRDLDKLLRENLTELQSAPILKRWEKENMPTVAVMPLRNETSEHIDSALDSLISDIETALSKSGSVSLISLENQPDLIAQVRKQYSDAYNPAEVAAWGKQRGAKYIVSGKVFSNDERADGERRVQYSMFLQILEVETSAIVFQNKTTLTKAIVK